MSIVPLNRNEQIKEEKLNISCISHNIGALASEFIVS
jgi:hypothetical protein